MKVLVTVTEVAEAEDDFEISGTSIDERYLEYDLNEWDDYAIEEAVQLAELHPEIEVVSATIGPDRCEETIRMALAKGVDRAVRVWDDALEAAEVLDVQTKAAILGSIVEDEEPDIVFTGVQASDDLFGATGVALADEIDYGWAAVVNGFEYDDEGTAEVHRELEGGVEELTTVDLPAVFTIQTGINEPRYASLRGIRQAQAKPIDTKALADLDVDPEAVEGRLTLREMYEPEAEGDVEVFEGAPGETAAQLAEVLRDRGVGEA